MPSSPPPYNDNQDNDKEFAHDDYSKTNSLLRANRMLSTSLTGLEVLQSGELKKEGKRNNNNNNNTICHQDNHLSDAFLSTSLPVSPIQRVPQPPPSPPQPQMPFLSLSLNQRNNDNNGQSTPALETTNHKGHEEDDDDNNNNNELRGNDEAVDLEAKKINMEQENDGDEALLVFDMDLE